MKRLLNPQLMLILLFLGIIATVPLVQTALEVAKGERPQAFEVFQRRPTARNLRFYERNLEDASWVAAELRPWAQFAQFAWLQDGGAKALVGRDGWLFYRPGVQFLTDRRETQKPTGCVAEALAAIAELDHQLAARGIRLLVMPVPNKESVYPERLTRRVGPVRKVIGPETAQLLSGLRALNIESIDLFELFAGSKASGADGTAALYLAQDSHWSPAGVACAARAVAQRIQQLGCVAPGAVDYQVKRLRLERLGDLLKMLQSPVLERTARPDIVTCEQVLLADSGAPYRDDVNSPILVLGDSFLRIYETDEPGGAGFIAHLAKELRQPLAAIVNDGGASTLVRQELARRSGWLARKKLVIWEFVERDIRLGTEGWQPVRLPPGGPPGNP